LSYVAFLSFIVATGLYWLMGPGGPLHSIDFLSIFRSQISEEEEGTSTRAALILVVAPLVLFALLYILVEGVFGSAAMLLLGTAALFFAFGREEFPTLTQRFLARARVGDNGGAARVIESAGGDSSADDVDDFGDVAASFFSVMALQRWFGPVIYFLLLGPIGAVAYRLAHLTQETKTPLSDSLMRLLEWLPSRLLLLSFSIFGDFDKSIEHFMGKGMTLDIDTGDFLEDATDAAVTLPADASVYDRLSAVFHLLERSFLLWIGAVALLVLI
jgi:AmpE protein